MDRGPTFVGPRSIFDKVSSISRVAWQFGVAAPRLAEQAPPLPDFRNLCVCP